MWAKKEREAQKFLVENLANIVNLGDAVKWDYYL
jgi:hypothetical protein